MTDRQSRDQVPDRKKQAGEVLDTLLEQAADRLQNNKDEVVAAERKYMLELIKFVGVSSPGTANSAGDRFRQAAEEHGLKLATSIPPVSEEPDAATGT